MDQYIFAADNPTVLDEIRAAIRGGDCLLMAGAGLSAQATTPEGKHPPLWEGLLRAAATWCRDRVDVDLDADEEKNIHILVEKHYLLEAGQEIESTLRGDKSKLQQCLRDVLLCNNAEPGEAHRHAAKIGFRAYLTTNYDTLIETAYSQTRGRYLMPFYENTIDGVLEQFRLKEPFIIKLHGDVNHPESIRLGDLSYERLLHDSANYRDCLKALFSVSSVLFIGFGGSDPNLDDFLSKVASSDGHRQRHWILVKEGKFPLFKAKNLLLYRGIKVIEYPEASGHTGLVSFLEKLAAPYVPVKVPMSLEENPEESTIGLEESTIGISSRIESISST